MEIDIYALLAGNPLLLVFVVLGLGLLVGHVKIGPTLLGSVTGAMTSTAARNVINEAARSAVPALGYAGTYTIANVLLTFAGTVVAMI
jgi:putative transport protein